MNTFIDLPNNFTASTTDVASTLFTDLDPYIKLFLGVLLVGVFIRFLFNAMN